MAHYFSTQSIEGTREEIGYVQAQITALDLEDEKLYRAYIAEVFDTEEYARKRHGLKEQRQRLEDAKAELERRFGQQTSKEQRKQQIFDAVDELRRRANENLPFELKRRMVLMVIDHITVNTAEEWFELKGQISGRFDFNPAGRGSELRRA